MLASATSKLISSHRGLVFRTSTAQRAIGGYIVRAFGFTPRGTPLLGVCDPEGSKEFYILKAISNVIVSWESRSNVWDGLGHRKELTELGTKPAAQQDINISFRHTSHIFERIEELEREEFLSSKINLLTNEISKAIYKQNNYIQTFCWISITLNVEQKRNTDSSCDCGIYVVIYFASFEVVAMLLLKI